MQCFLDDGVERVETAVSYYLENQLSEKGVLPCEPFPGEVEGIVLVERLMDEARACVGGDELDDAVAYLVVVIGSESLHHYAHRPDHLHTDVRASDAFAGCSAEEIRVGLAPYETPGVLIYRVIGRDISEI